MRAHLYVCVSVSDAYKAIVLEQFARTCVGIGSLRSSAPPPRDSMVGCGTCMASVASCMEGIAAICFAMSGGHRMEAEAEAVPQEEDAEEEAHVDLAPTLPSMEEEAEEEAEEDPAPTLPSTEEEAEEEDHDPPAPPPPSTLSEADPCHQDPIPDPFPNYIFPHRSPILACPSLR